MQRFTGRFADCVVQASEKMAGDPRSPVHQPAMRRVLLIQTAALEIAAGPAPEVNLLDMLVFATLCRDAYERHWMPKVFGEGGAPLLKVLQSSEQELWALSEKVLNPTQQAQLREIIRAWQASHPEQVRVESVRLSDFARLATDPARARAASGIMASVRAATQAADQALLLGERALFLAPRLPLVLRLQARLGMHELVSDSLVQLDRVDGLLDRALALHPLIDKVSLLAERAGATARDARELSEAALPLTQAVERLLAPESAAFGQGINRVEELVRSSLRLSESTRLLVQDTTQLISDRSEQAWTRTFSGLDRLARRMLVYLVLLGLAWAAAFWGSYALIVRSARPAQGGVPGTLETPGAEPCWARAGPSAGKRGMVGPT